MRFARVHLPLLLIAFVVTGAFAEREPLDTLVPEMSRQGISLAAGFEFSLDFANCLQAPGEALVKRRAWHGEGFRHTTELLERLDFGSEVDGAVRIILLLGGTHDDRAALSLLALIESELRPKIRWAVYAALAELGHYTEHHAGLLLEAATEGRKSKNESMLWESSLLLATIHHPDAVWAQDQLERRGLIDGGLSAQIGVLLRFRDLALGR